MSTPARNENRTPGDDLPVRRIDRVLAFSALGLLVFSVLCFVAIIIGSAAGMDHASFGSGMWPAVGAAVYIAPIAGFALLMVVLIMTFVRKARANRGG